MAGKYDGVEKFMFSDLYLFFLKYKDIPNEDYYWNVCMEDAKILNFKWKDHPYMRAMLVDTINHLEHIIKKDEEGGKTREQWEEALTVAKEGKAFNSTNPFNNGK